MTGNWSNLGQSSVIALRMAEEDINAYFDSHQIRTKVKVTIFDTSLDPAKALLGYDTLLSQGITGIVGPQSSSEVAALEDAVAQKKAPIVSQGSTASSLAKANDHVYRIVPDDVQETLALTSALQARGIRYVVPVWRDDVGNKGLHDSLVENFTKVGGTVYEGYKYSTSAIQNYDAIAQSLEKEVRRALSVADGQSRQVAVYAASFDEIVFIMQAAEKYPTLSTIRWYGGDGVVQSAALAADPTAASFALSVDFLSPNLGLSMASAAKAKSVSDRYKAITGSSPDAFTLAAYDATWILALTSGGKKNVLKRTNPDPLIETANMFFGATGWAEINAYGDRASGDYDFWGLKRSDTGNIYWAVMCHYDNVMKEISGSECSQP